VGIVANIELFKYFIKGGNELQQALYWSGLPVVPVLLMGYAFLGIYMNLSIWYKLSDQTRYGLYISGIGALLTIILNVVFIPQYSYFASAWITLIVYLTMMVISYVLGQKTYAIPYHISKNCGYLLGAAILSWICFTIFSINILIGNGLFFIFIVLTLLIEKKQFLKLIRKKDDY